MRPWAAKHGDDWLTPTGALLSDVQLSAPPLHNGGRVDPGLNFRHRSWIEERLRMAGQVRTGIGGWTFEPWRGVFYPKGLRQADELAYAASKLGAIEINGTYYSLQKPQSFAAWRAATPDDFRFTVKGSRFCTNRRVLAEAGEAIGRFMGQGLSELGDKLGPDPLAVHGHQEIRSRGLRRLPESAAPHTRWPTDPKRRSRFATKASPAPSLRRARAGRGGRDLPHRKRLSSRSSPTSRRTSSMPA